MPKIIKIHQGFFTSTQSKKKTLSTKINKIIVACLTTKEEQRTKKLHRNGAIMAKSIHVQEEERRKLHRELVNDSTSVCIERGKREVTNNILCSALQIRIDSHIFSLVLQFFSFSFLP